MNMKAIAASLLAALSIGAATSASATIYTSNSSVAICDLCDVSSTLFVGSHGLITDLNVLINSLTHTFDGDLRISLIAPNATEILLSNRRGSSGDNFVNTVFDDEALSNVATASAPFTGTFRPQGSLSVLDGLDAYGTWTLRVQDLASFDVGSINSWGVNITAASVPEPGSLALVGLGLFGLMGLHRRRAA